ncbi:DUF3732 domain-containing protein [Morganella morganii]|uniref:DUF3732 domain-containing protein n=1 Tax=Morganella morganii TaxID=582 RepID=UPI001C461C07|nr:DUF3732 domain-containing protein [Morganella morganii]QXO42026.1 DUF3732 domain-containing protein [Morganella morganii]QXO49314.1 DUF3732 domain-containing protein [Morganella morganii]QXO60886.1 DUF3732 domain-containing protein [Morganella morganii]QXO68361.1 DUF3732 domain-containing protein [Morganella morganii]
MDYFQQKPTFHWNGRLYLNYYKPFKKKDPNLAQPSVDSIQNIVNELKNLRERETNIVTEFNILRNQLIEIEKLNESSDLYKKALNIKRERLSLSTWIRDKYHSADVTESLNGTYSSDKIQQLCQALEGIELRLRSYPQINQSLGKETLYLRTQLSELTHKLSLVREEIKLLELASEQAGRSNRQNELVAHFLGRLEEAMRLYQTTDTLTPLNNEIKELKKEQKRLFKIVSEKDIAKKLDSVLNKVQRNIGRILPYLDGEWPDSPVSLIIPDLTVKVNRGGRDDYLWETGSGANWLAYHIATTLALQWIFSQLKHHPVPGLLIYDQPSQVYFPVRKAEKSAIDSNDPHWQDEDIVAVRKVFNTLDMFISATKKEFQIIVLDHANEDVWYDLDNVHLVEEWRGKALVPYEWKDESI